MTNLDRTHRKNGQKCGPGHHEFGHSHFKVVLMASCCHIFDNFYDTSHLGKNSWNSTECPLSQPLPHLEGLN